MKNSKTWNILRWLLPNGGTILVALILIATQSVWAKNGTTKETVPNSSTNTISYQGQLTNTSGTPLNGDYDLTFRLYNVANGGTALWTEQWTGANNITVTDGLFHVMLGNLMPIPQTVFTGNSNLWLGVKVGADNEMTPRIQLGSSPFAIQALTVPDLAIQTNHIADGAVTGPKLSRQLIEVILPASVPMPNANTTYDILSQIINPSEQALVTVHASIALQNNTNNAFFEATLLIDGNIISQAHSWNTAAIGEQKMLSTAVLVDPGQHVIKLQALSSSAGSIAVAGSSGRTRLVIVQE